MAHGYAKDRDAILRRLGRIQGQVGGIGRMVEADKYCIDILTQISAAKSALDQVAMLLLEDHVHHCVVDAARRGETEKLDELVAAVGRFARS